MPRAMLLRHAVNDEDRAFWQQAAERLSRSIGVSRLYVLTEYGAGNVDHSQHRQSFQRLFRTESGLYERWPSDDNP